MSGVLRLPHVLILNSFQDTFGQRGPGSRLDLRQVVCSASGGQVLECLCEQTRRSNRCISFERRRMGGPLLAHLDARQKKRSTDMRHETPCYLLSSWGLGPSFVHRRLRQR